jgi:methylase of polypeptide subunit release factors
MRKNTLLGKVELHVHRSDTMYQPNAASHYLSVGLSASRCIREAIRSNRNECTIKTILDFPVGYGRVLRFLRSMFPGSDITAAEIDANALDFCRRTFSVTTLLSKTNLGDLSLPSVLTLSGAVHFSPISMNLPP